MKTKKEKSSVNPTKMDKNLTYHINIPESNREQAQNTQKDTQDH